MRPPRIAAAGGGDYWDYAESRADVYCPAETAQAAAVYWAELEARALRAVYWERARAPGTALFPLAPHWGPRCVPAVKRCCACGRFLGLYPGNNSAADKGIDPVTHGICASCARELYGEYLDP